MIAFSRFQKIAEANGLKAKQCSAHHFQIIGGALIVNYYPNSKKHTVYVNGAVDGKSHVSLDEAINIASGTSKKKVSTTKDKRKKSYKALKRKMYDKDNKCCWCHIEMTYQEATIEHEIPLDKGGSNREDNLALAHEQCNSEHGNNLPRLPEKTNA